MQAIHAPPCCSTACKSIERLKNAVTPACWAHATHIRHVASGSWPRALTPLRKSHAACLHTHAQSRAQAERASSEQRCAEMQAAFQAKARALREGADSLARERSAALAAFVHAALRAHAPRGGTAAAQAMQDLCALQQASPPAEATAPAVHSAVHRLFRALAAPTAQPAAGGGPQQCTQQLLPLPRGVGGSVSAGSCPERADAGEGRAQRAEAACAALRCRAESAAAAAGAAHREKEEVQEQARCAQANEQRAWERLAAAEAAAAAARAEAATAAAKLTAAQLQPAPAAVDPALVRHCAYPLPVCRQSAALRSCDI